MKISQNLRKFSNLWANVKIFEKILIHLTKLEDFLQNIKILRNIKILENIFNFLIFVGFEENCPISKKTL